jgi:solute carrier family 25 carnitine/acylcarnitine transporter 20/29
MMSGGVAGVASWLFTYPVDVCKSLVQGLPLSTPRAERTLAAVLKHNRGLEGNYRFLARGLTPTLARAFPCSAVVFPVFEWTLTMLESSSPDSHQDELHHVS